MPAAPPLVTLTAEQALQAVCTAVATVIAPTPLVLGKTDQVGPSGPTVYLWPVSDVGVGYVGSLYGAITTTAYDVSTLPTTVVVAPDGSVADIHVGPMSYSQLERAVR